MRPLIVTGALPAAIGAWADGLRRAHYPPERNRLKAHLTLFHAIPPSCERELRHFLADLARVARPPPACIDGLLDLGSGTALRVRSEEMDTLRERIAERFEGSLTMQDRQRPRLHVTVQNKVRPSEARSLQAQMGKTFETRRFVILALEGWFYRDGAWESAGRWPFRGTRPQHG